MKLAVAVLLMFLYSLASAADTGVLQLRIRDSHTGFIVHAVIEGSGPKSFSVSTDDRGYGRVALPPGEYQLRISATDYSMMSTHFPVESGKTTKAGAFLDPLLLPAEESQAVLDSLSRPGHTLLHEYVFDAVTGKPLQGVKVRFVLAGVQSRTDAKGHFYLLVPTPPPDFPGGLGTDTLVYEKSGYKTIVMKHMGLGGSEMGGGGIDMKNGEGKIVIDATHKLMRK